MADSVAALPDDAARRRIATDLDATLFVEAGAGSGKTSALVGRVVALVAAGVELRSIAAITFTEKAGAELRDRLRHELDQMTASADPLVAGRGSKALDQLDGAAVGTLHAFAQSILSQHPVEAGLPPAIEVLDEVSSGVEFDRRWQAFFDGVLEDPSLAESLVVLDVVGVKPAALKVLAVGFNNNWDLVAERVEVVEPGPIGVRPLVDHALDAAAAVCAQSSACRGPDKLLERLGPIADWVAGVRAIDDAIDLVEALDKRPSFRVGNVGKQELWAIDLGEFKADLAAAANALSAAQGRIGEAAARLVAGAMRGFTLGAADERRAAGRLEFHDLLVLARTLLRDPDHGPAVRARLHARYQRILLDEFQDTDPIQIELAVRIAAAEPAGDAAGAAEWEQVDVTPGQLFFVGDPKQSIYRFRRADLETFGAAKTRFGPPVELTTNFRTGAPIIAWVNATFESLIGQKAFTALDAYRPVAPAGPSVSVVGRDPIEGGRADDLRAAEAAEVAAAVGRVLADEWQIADTDGGWRPARLGDVAILVPARTSLPFLEDALDAAGVPFRAEASSLVYATRAVRDLVMVLRAVADPTDGLRVVSALRTPLLGCGDDDLWRHRVEAGGSWNYLADQPAGVVGEALAYLRQLNDDRVWATPSELLARIAADRRAFELGFVEGRPRDVWRRLRFVIDQARAWHEATGGTLRGFLHWVDLQTAEGARVAEAVLPETDDDAVRIMTIHAAKGLEFPVTIVSGLSTKPITPASSAQVVFPRDWGVGYKIGKAITTATYEEWKAIDEQMALDERIRLLYVACTRARDHLVVSLVRDAKVVDDPAKMTNAQLLVDGMGAALDALPDADDGTSGALHPLVPTPPDPVMGYDEWEAERTAALARGRRPTTIAATALTAEGTPAGDDDPDDGLQKRPRDLDLPPWLKGRYGTSVGRAVHAVLQTVDLATGAGLDALVAAQCEAEAIPGRTADVRALVTHALGAPSVRAAAAAPHWREVYACTPIGDRLLEGYVDLLYRSADGLVVVDHKTASSADPDDLVHRVSGYRMQGASYALAVAAATGEPVVRVTFLFLTPSGAVEIDLDDLADAVAEVSRLAVAQTG